MFAQTKHPYPVPGIQVGPNGIKVDGVKVFLAPKESFERLNLLPATTEVGGEMYSRSDLLIIRVVSLHTALLLDYYSVESRH